MTDPRFFQKLEAVDRLIASHGGPEVKGVAAAPFAPAQRPTLKITPDKDVKLILETLSKTPKGALPLGELARQVSGIEDQILVQGVLTANAVGWADIVREGDVTGVLITDAGKSALGV